MLRAKNIGLRLAYEQWGYVTNNNVGDGHSGTNSTTFPIAFNGIYQLVCSSFKQTTSYKGTSTVYAYTNSTVTFAAYDGGYIDKTMYIALGY